MGMWKRRIKGPMPRKMRSLYIRGKKGVVCLFVLEVKIFFDAMKNFFREGEKFSPKPRAQKKAGQARSEREECVERICFSSRKSAVRAGAVYEGKQLGFLNRESEGTRWSGVRMRVQWKCGRCVWC